MLHIKLKGMQTTIFPYTLSRSLDVVKMSKYYFLLEVVLLLIKLKFNHAYIMVCYLESGSGLMYCVAFFRLVWQSLYIERKIRP